MNNLYRIRNISQSEPCFIIAEIGVNHNGSVEIAEKLVDAAVEAKVDAVKFQTFKAENLVTPNVGKAEYQHRSNEKNQFQMLKNLELKQEDFITLKSYCDDKKIEFISTPYDIESLEFLNQVLDVHRLKIASADIINFPLLKAAALTKKQIILSTGMASLSEIDTAVSQIKKEGNDNIILLHCTTSYPTLYHHVNMETMKTLSRSFNLVTGYSDHTIGLSIPIMAVALGAKVIEKHFTLDRTMKGPDHFASLEPHELKDLVIYIRNVEEAFGSRTKIITEEEKKNSYFMRRSVHAATKIEKGEVISEYNIKIVRPFDGLSPKFYYIIIGKNAKISINQDMPIKWNDLL